MAKKGIEVDKSKLTEIINTLEASEKFDNLSKLYKKVAKEYGDKYGVQISHSLVYLRVKQFGIETQTKKAVFDPSQFKERLNKTPNSGDCIAPRLKQTVNELLDDATAEERQKYTKLAKSVIRGSRKAAIKLNCIKCSGYQTKEVKLCEINTCPFWAFRPYQ